MLSSILLMRWHFSHLMSSQWRTAFHDPRRHEANNRDQSWLPKLTMWLEKIFLYPESQRRKRPFSSRIHPSSPSRSLLGFIGIVVSSPTISRSFTASFPQSSPGEHASMDSIHPHMHRDEMTRHGWWSSQNPFQDWTVLLHISIHWDRWKYPSGDCYLLHIQLLICLKYLQRYTWNFTMGFNRSSYSASYLYLRFEEQQSTLFL